jgi:thioesterase domain-containing protein
MMLAGYAFLWLELDSREAHLVISKSAISFRGPVHGTLRAVCARPPPKELDKFRSDFAAQGKGKISLEVEIQQDDKTAASLEGIYVARRS